MAKNNEYLKQGIDVLIQKMDLIKEKIDDQQQKISGLEAKIDQVPSKIKVDINQDINHCKELHSVRITAIEQNCNLHMQKTASLELKIIETRPYSSIQNRPESLYK
jgi:hypothetical protein